MFKGDKGKSNPDSPDRLNRLVSGTKLTGDLVVNSSLRVDGEVEGNIQCNGKLVLGKEGLIVGNVNATEVEVDGTVEGQIDAEILLTLHKTASIKGDIATGRIVIEDGAQIEGNIQTGDTQSKGKKSLMKKKAKVKVEQKETVSEPVA